MDYNNGNSYSYSGVRGTGRLVNVNTKLYTSYSDTSLLTVSAWNNNLSLKFHPIKGVNPETGAKQFAQNINELTNVSISPEAAYSLIEGIENIIIPAIGEKEEKRIVYMLGSENARRCFSIFTKKDDDSDNVSVYLSASYDNSVEFEDNPNTYIEHKLSTRKFRNKSDKSDEIMIVQADLLDKLKKIDNLSQTIEHGVIYTSKLKEYARQQDHHRNSYGQGAMNPPYQAEEVIAPMDGNISDFVPFS